MTAHVYPGPEGCTLVITDKHIVRVDARDVRHPTAIPGVTVYRNTAAGLAYNAMDVPRRGDLVGLARMLKDDSDAVETLAKMGLAKR